MLFSLSNYQSECVVCVDVPRPDDQPFQLGNILHKKKEISVNLIKIFTGKPCFSFDNDFRYIGTSTRRNLLNFFFFLQIESGARKIALVRSIERAIADRFSRERNSARSFPSFQSVDRVAIGTEMSR